MNNTPHLTLDTETSRIYLNHNNTQQDITENVIEVITHWFLSTDVSIGLQNPKTGKQYLITCLEVSTDEYPIEPTKH